MRFAQSHLRWRSSCGALASRFLVSQVSLMTGGLRFVNSTLRGLGVASQNDFNSNLCTAKNYSHFDKLTCYSNFMQVNLSSCLANLEFIPAPINTEFQEKTFCMPIETTPAFIGWLKTPLHYLAAIAVTTSLKFSSLSPRTAT